MAEIYRTSDTHFGHNKEEIWRARGFRSVGEHDAGVFDSLASVLTAEDSLIHFGDVGIEGSWELALDYMRALPGRKTLIIGNHDRIFENKRDRAKFWPAYAEVFTGGIFGMTRERLAGRSFVQSHFPYWPNDRVVARHEQFRAPNAGLPIVHGHTHSEDRHEWPNHFGVGWDAWRRPVAQNELIEWLLTLAPIKEVR